MKKETAPRNDTSGFAWLVGGGVPMRIPLLYSYLHSKATTWQLFSFVDSTKSDQHEHEQYRTDKINASTKPSLDNHNFLQRTFLTLLVPVFTLHLYVVERLWRPTWRQFLLSMSSRHLHSSFGYAYSLPIHTLLCPCLLRKVVPTAWLVTWVVKWLHRVFLPLSSPMVAIAVVIITIFVTIIIPRTRPRPHFIWQRVLAAEEAISWIVFLESYEVHSTRLCHPWKIPKRSFYKP